VTVVRRVRTFAELVRFEHTIFALPFAYAGAFVGARGLPAWPQLFWITVAMVGARTVAMVVNRLADREIDARNPRTAARHLPAGVVKAGEATLLAAASLALLLVAAWNLNPLCVALFPLAVAMVIFYSFTKRFTWLSHYFLGAGIAWSAFGGYIAVTGAVQPPALLLAAIVACWIAGFDILYATQDLEHDRQHGLHSIPSRFGLRRSLQIARATHLAVVGLMLLLGFQINLLSLSPGAWGAAGWLYATGWGVAAALLHYEHALISPEDMSRLNAAFFNVNGYISVAYFIFTAAALLAAA
jgi:4-hydroxybenzoate polyprenyltransferase